MLCSKSYNYIKQTTYDNLHGVNVKAEHMHSDTKTIDRVQISPLEGLILRMVRVKTLER